MTVERRVRIYSGAAAGDLTGNTAGTQQPHLEARSHLRLPYPPALVVFLQLYGMWGVRGSVGPRISGSSAD